MAKIEITKAQFEAYVRVQKSGALTGLDKNQCMEIMSNYSELEEKHQ